jgi:hypothetical protein
LFSAAGLWEVAMKNGLGRHALRVDVLLLWRGLLYNVAQATVEGITLLAAVDPIMAEYNGPGRNTTGLVKRA